MALARRARAGSREAGGSGAGPAWAQARGSRRRWRADAWPQARGEGQLSQSWRWAEHGQAERRGADGRKGAGVRKRLDRQLGLTWSAQGGRARGSGLGRAVLSGWWRHGYRRQASTEARLSGVVQVAVFHVGELQHEGEIGGQVIRGYSGDTRVARTAG
jgi:hypothetical protein